LLLAGAGKIIGRVTTPPIGPVPFLIAGPDGTGTGLVVMPRTDLPAVAPLTAVVMFLEAV